MITAEKTFAMLGNRTLWDTARHVHDILTKAEIPYAVVGGVAVCLHGYQRNTIDLDLLVRPNDRDRIVDILVSNDFRYDLKKIFNSQLLMASLFSLFKAGIVKAMARTHAFPTRVIRQSSRRSNR